MRWIGTAALGASVGIAIGMGALWAEGRFDAPAKATVLSGTANVGGPFALIDTNGRAVTDRDLHGRPLLITFAYSRCPQTCVATLQTLGAAMAELNKDPGDGARAVVVTIDPETDSAAVFGNFLKPFEGAIVGLRGSRSDVRDLAARYGLPIARDGDTRASDARLAAPIYLMASDGRYVDHFPLGTEPTDIIARVRAQQAS